ncbi:MAG: BON domain-containing protein [Proteobacteria bacterium]|nr:BON domain-containing protein [Pseudomonadota bacterium]
MSLRKLFPVTLFAIPALFLFNGCAPVIVVGAAGGGAATAHDERSTQTILDDQVIEAKAKDALYKDPERAKRIHINITSYNHVVLLTGEVLSKKLRNQVVDIVRHLDKVRRVHNEIRFADLTGFQSRTNDSWITSKVKTQMLTAKGFDSTRVKVITEAGTVYLMGLVTRDTGNRAANIARQISGVKRVVKVFEYL